jgi:hypothetical protein
MKQALLNFFIFLAIILAKGIQYVFIGPLRVIEVEHVYERSWFAISETCLAMTIFRDDFDARFVFMLTLLLMVKCFFWIVSDRIDAVCCYMNSFLISIVLMVDGTSSAIPKPLDLRSIDGPDAADFFGFVFGISILFGGDAEARPVHDVGLWI